MPDEEYFSHAALNQTAFKNFLVSPKNYMYKLTAPKKLNQDFILGHIVHCLFLEPEEFSKRFILFSETKTLLSEKARSCAAAVGPGFEIYTPDMLVQAESMVACLKDSDIMLPVPKMRELAAVSSICGVHIKAKADWICHEGFINDLKTTNDLDGFEYKFRRFGYHIQACWYLSAFSDMDPEGFRVWAVSKNKPYDCRLFQVSHETLVDARDVIMEQLPKFKACLENDEWPGYDNSEPVMI
jgi:hypothetical protein